MNRSRGCGTVCSVGVVDEIEELTTRLISANGMGLHQQDVAELIRVERLRAAQGQRAHYVTASRNDGTLVGLLPVYPTVPPYLDSSALTLLGGGELPGEHSAVLYLGSLGILPNWAMAKERRSDTIRALIATGLELGTEEGMDVVCVPLLYDEIADDVASGLPATIIRQETHEAFIDIWFPSFQAYLDTFPARRRNEIRQQRRRFCESNLDIAEVSLLEEFSVLAPLMRRVESKYGSNEPLETFEAFLFTTAVAMGEQCTTLVAHEHGVPAAFSVIWHRGPDWRMRSWGCNYDKVEGTFAYFEMTIYQPLVMAAATGARTLTLGAEGLPAKTKRGARLRRLTTLAAAL